MEHLNQCFLPLPPLSELGALERDEVGPPLAQIAETPKVGGLGETHPTSSYSLAQRAGGGTILGGPVPIECTVKYSANLVLFFCLSSRRIGLQRFDWFLLTLFLSLVVAENFMSFLASLVPYYIIAMALYVALFGVDCLTVASLFLPVPTAASSLQNNDSYCRTHL